MGTRLRFQFLNVIKLFLYHTACAYNSGQQSSRNAYFGYDIL